MHRILLVDDDALVLRLFRDALARQSFEVVTASDGLEAMRALRASRPDLVVLDLLMPKLTGVDVLEFIRSQADLKNLPVIVLSNSYIGELAQGAKAVGVQEALLKSRCTPATLVESIQQQLGPLRSGDRAPPQAVVPVPGRAASPAASEVAEDERGAQARQEFLAKGDEHCAALGVLFKKLHHAPNQEERLREIEALCRKIHFVNAGAAVTGCHRIAKLTSALEGLLYVLMDRPVELNESVLLTLQAALELLEALFRPNGSSEGESLLNPQFLVVDDDPLSNKLEVLALRRAQFHAYGVQDPVAALQRLEQADYHAILLDIEMPVLDGFEFCRRVRSLPRYERVPIIYVTSHADVQSRAEALLSGGNDLIAKPIFPMELAVKAITHLLKSELPE